MVSSSPPSGFICLPTRLTPDLLHPLRPNVLWCVVYFYLHLTHPCSIFVTPLSSDPPLSPITPLDFHDSESAYSFYFYLPLCLLLGYGLCAGPALNMYVYNVWCLLLAFSRLDINLDLSTACLLYSNLRVVLVHNSLHPISISCSCVFVALQRKPAHRVSPLHSIFIILGGCGT